jgi:deazaflavin-dependent oxidoreductase (nitroreductase family)
MTMSGWNESVVAEFRGNGGRVGGQFAGANMILMHHVGRRSGTEYIAPVVFFTRADDPGAMFVVASAAGAARNPQWYDNMTSAGHATVEVGTESFEVEVSEVTGERYAQVFGDIKAQAPGFGEYEKKIAGVRTMPVLVLRRRGRG